MYNEKGNGFKPFIIPNIQLIQRIKFIKKNNL